MRDSKIKFDERDDDMEYGTSLSFMLYFSEMTDTYPDILYGDVVLCFPYNNLDANLCEPLIMPYNKISGDCDYCDTLYSLSTEDINELINMAARDKVMCKIVK